MKNKPVLSYISALLVCLVFGFAAAGLLHLWDRHMDYPAALTEGNRFALPVCGFSLIAPEGAILEDLTPSLQQTESNPLYAARIALDDGALYISCYPNPNGDSIDDHAPQTLITNLLVSGAQEPRMRTFGGRSFVQYTAEDSDSTTRYYAYETWDAYKLILIETALAESTAIPILGSIAFDSAQP